MSLSWNEAEVPFLKYRLQFFSHHEDPVFVVMGNEGDCGIHYSVSSRDPDNYELEDKNILVLANCIVWNADEKRRVASIKKGEVSANLRKVTSVVASILDVPEDRLQQLADCIWRGNCNVYGRTRSPTPLRYSRSLPTNSPAGSRPSTSKAGSVGQSTRKLFENVSRSSTTDAHLDGEEKKSQDQPSSGGVFKGWTWPWSHCFGNRKS